MTGYCVSGSARNFASGVTTRSTVEPFCTTFRPILALRVCSPDRLSTVASHITGAGITARFLFFLSVNCTLPSDNCFAFRPLTFSGSVYE
ncbi:hypothetical protein RKD41_002346 [Streptomyces tendae]